ncbi:phage tail length tape measure family protein [Dyella sp. 2RAB6]|uniref:phage tail length tape measure family protein n=1 Tax=Dyella sp. 2RAB6 TaxID=3232992 RepID=UPI003F936BC6
MTGPNLDVALRIKADLDTARSQVKALNQDVSDTGKAADAANAALGRSSQRMDALLATTAQVVQVLQSMDARLATLSQSSVQAAQATEQVEAGAHAAVTGVRALAEAEDEAAARIREVIAASREQAAAATASAAAYDQVAIGARQNASQVDDVARSVERQNAQMARSSVAAAEAAVAERQAAGAAQDHAAELSALLGQIDPTIAALERLDAQEQELQRFRSLGLIDDESFARFRGQIETSRQALGRMGVSAGQTAQAMRQLPAQITDVTVSLASGMPVWLVAIQQGGQIRDSFGGISNALRGVATLLTPTRVGLGLLAGAVGLLSAAAIEGYRDQQQLINTLIATGNYAALSASQLRMATDDIGQATGQYGSAREAIEAFSASGKVSGETLVTASQAAVDFSRVTGQSVDQAVKELLRIADDPVRAIQQLDQQYHFLSTTQLQQITQLQQEGNATQAVATAYSALADTMARRAKDVQANLGYVERTWTFIKEAGSYWKDQALGLGAQSTGDERLLELQREANKWARQIEALKSQQQTTTGISIVDDFAASSAQQELKYAQDQYAKAASLYRAEERRQAQEDRDRASAATAAQVQSEGNAAATRIDQLTLSLDRAKQRQDALNKAAADLYKIHLAGGKLPEGVNFNGAAADTPQGAGWDRIKAEIEKRYADPKVATPKLNTKEAVNAQQELIQMLNQLQGQLDPTAAAWAKYNETVARATKQAEEAKKAPSANVAGIDAERQAVIQLAAAIRAADIKRITDEERQGWERLRESLRTPIEVAVETATTRIAELNKYLKDGIITAGQYQQALGRTVQAGFTKPPQFSGLAPEVGGAFGEIGKTFDAQKQLELWYQQQLQILNQFRAQKLGTEAQWNAQEQALQKQHEDSLQQIVVARQTAELAAASSVFGNLADLAKARFGEESKSYRALFALSKAFSIAQAAVSLATNVSKASEAGFPANLPLIAAAFAQGAQIVGLLSGASFSPSGYATGGEIDGPGTATSDSVLIRASRGEFMQRAAAVDYYGLDFMHAVNSLQYPRFATGGLIDAPRLSVSPSPRAPAIAPPAGSAAAARPIYFRAVNVVDPGLITDTMAGPDGEEVFMNFIDRNAVKIKQRIG